MRGSRRGVCIAACVVLAASGCTRDAAPRFNPISTAAARPAPTAPPVPAVELSPKPVVSRAPSARVTGLALSPFPSLSPEADEPPKPGSSSVVITGEVQLRTTQDFQCSYAVDDFFVRGRMASYQGIPMYLSINVEFYKRPGAYVRRTQVLIRRISRDNTFYASWYQNQATGTVRPGRGGFDLETIEIPPEPGTQSTRSITAGGHFGCENQPTPGPG